MSLKTVQIGLVKAFFAPAGSTLTPCLATCCQALVCGIPLSVPLGSDLAVSSGA